MGIDYKANDLGRRKLQKSLHSPLGISMAAPSRAANISLYRKLLRAAKSFTQYNFRDYAIRYVRDDFRAASTLVGEEARDAFVHGTAQLQILRRQSAISMMFPAGKHVMDSDDNAQPVVTKQE